MSKVLVSPVQCVFWEDGTAVCMARLVNAVRTTATQASFASITRRVYDLDGTTSDESITAGDASLTIASCVFDTLQTDARWTKDETGYNFRDEVPAAVFANGGHTYLIEYKITAATGEVGYFQFKGPASAVKQN